MGINNLNKILKRHAPECYVEVHLYKYAFERIAIDTSLFVYKYKTIFGEKWLNAFINMICCLRKNEIHPIFIFDSKQMFFITLERTGLWEAHLGAEGFEASRLA